MKIIHTPVRIAPVETCRLRQHGNHNPEIEAFVNDMASIFSAVPAGGCSEQLTDFLATVFCAGHVSGVRHERYWRRWDGGTAYPEDL